jgi:hypothetical protein
MKKLIINADDYGICDSISRGILDCYSNGLVSDFSFLINPDNFRSSLALLSARGIDSCGLHLNLILGNTLLTPKMSLTDENGKYFSVKEHFLNYLTGKLKTEDVYEEFRFQFDMIRREGMRITHLDTHQNVHILPPVYAAVKKLSHEIGGKIPIRIPRERIDPKYHYMLSNLGRIVIFNVFSTFLKNGESKEDHVHVIGGDFFNNPSPGKVFKNIIRRIKESPFDVFELAVHPGYFSEEILKYDPYGRPREIELHHLIKPMGDFERNGISVCSFSSLKK